ncbi:hypothetical protein AAGS40_27255 (plasmid) [Paraburkholderia sp. PREW-6R]|uniref:hypothetical protein n=1 Tax=Paraburkholderia sp. PREW-6R TaxID=3141544 RepID=UPI0031F4CBD4
MDWNVEFWWFLVNVVVAAMGPWIANFVLWRLDHISDRTAEWRQWDAYRDGQLGFVAVGWSAAALYDIATHPTLWPNPNPGIVQMGLIIAIVGGALFAAKGARDPVRGTLPAAPHGVSFGRRLWDRLMFYQAFTFTLGFTLLSLVLMLVEHANVALNEAQK